MSLFIFQLVAFDLLDQPFFIYMVRQHLVFCVESVFKATSNSFLEGNN